MDRDTQTEEIQGKTKDKKQLGNKICCTENTDKKKRPRDHVCNFVKDFFKILEIH